MANLVSTEKAHLVLGTTTLLDEVSLGISEGQRIGVVGANGGGKSTLLRVLAGTLSPDSGRVTRNSDLRVGMLSQDDTLDPDATVAHAVLGGQAEHEWAADARVRDVLTGLLGGLDAPVVNGMDALVRPLSGGERRRVALASLLVADPDLLLLDEPTNHLDVEGVAWLADHLATRRTRPGSALVAVTHDRWFLDAIATDTWEVAEGSVHAYDGGYAAFVLAKAERVRVAAVSEERRQNLMRKELAWLRRGAPARTSKPRFRIDAANELIRNEPEPRDTVELARFATTRLGKDVIDLIDATVILGEGEPGERRLLDRVTWRLAPGDRVGIVGVNGAGKSTLIRTFLGEVPLAAGKRKEGKTVVARVLTQDLRELDALAGVKVVDAITEIRSYTMLGKKEISASQLAQRLGFTGIRQQSLVGELSGGERRRLQFVRLLMEEPNVLFLDEPTNDLDIETLTSMEDVLDGWAGTLVVVSHDRYLLERMCDRQVALLGDGKVRDLPGGVEQYLELRRTRPHANSRRIAPSAATPAGSPNADGSSAPASSASSSAAGATAAAYSPAEVRAARKDVARIEKSLQRLTEKEARIHDQMAAAGTDYEAAAALNGELGQVHEEREELELAWLEAAEVAGH